MTDHPHLGEVEKAAVFGEIGCPLLDEGQICQVHAQVRDTGRITSMQCFPHVTKPAIRGDERLQLIDRLSGLLVEWRQKPSRRTGKRNGDRE